MPTQKLGRLLALTLVLVALFGGAATVAGVQPTGDATTLEFEWT
ncbi:hypothetical protein GA0070624_0144 [Micromonospora rhizosphaerae]|uniref:Uncharacterized protein n=1 Tax=Micromonospora rhizosphaerae TaxID=568872 RepID=A0A1C6R969_9ACTN|nr:hypothetical protein [Micromonospora rhizosphaerae]SCL13477.1 hypothetical protein GA0070624_0144 [Micromonospora rhizosphaerae]